jgi:FkbM family methyltransferase
MSRQEIYITLMRLAGAPRFVSRSRYLRFAFLKTLGHLQRWFGIPAETREVVLYSGTRLSCDLHDNLQAELFFLRSYSDAELRVLRNGLVEGDVVLDIGAHIGLFTIELARHVGRSGRVIAFEPAPDLAERLRKNIERNRLGDRVDVVEIALGNESGSAILRAASGYPRDAGRRSLFGHGVGVATVPVRTLDDLLASGELDTPTGIHGIKIDVEGAELHVLEGMRVTLRHYRPRIVLVEAVEANLGRSLASTRELSALMRSLGYRPLPGNAGDGKRHRKLLNIAFVPGHDNRTPPLPRAA